MADEKKAGSGVTSRQMVVKLVDLINSSFERDLASMGIKPKVRGDMLSGVKDGARAMIQHLIAMGVLAVLDESEVNAAAAAAKAAKESAS